MKIHFRATVQGRAACACRFPNADGTVRLNSRATYAQIPASYIVRPDEFRAALPEDRCAHCAGLFTQLMNNRRKQSGKPLYSDAFTKTLA